VTLIAWVPAWIMIKSFGAGAWAFLLGNRWARIALAVVLALMLGRCGLSYVEGLQTERDQSKARLVICQQASQTQVATIESLLRAELENSTAYAQELKRSKGLIDHLRKNEQERETRTDETIEQVREAASGNDCADQPLPDGLRVRLRP